MGDLHTTYRPKTFDEVVGQDAVVKSVKRVLEQKQSRAFIFIGPAGTGKTTLARIIASEVGCDRKNLTEVDAGQYSGVDDMRGLTESAQYSGMGSSSIKFNILDEVQMLSKSAWNSLLKIVEEPPPHLWWAFCTTEATKIPQTIKTRCVQYTLQPVESDLIYNLLRKVAKKEGLKTSEDVLSIISEKCDGSVRQALTGLALCGACTSRKEAAKLLREADSAPEAIHLCRALAKGGLNWASAMKLVEPIKDMKGEGIRMTVVGYFTTMLLGATSNDQAARGLAVLSAFSDPYPSEAGIYPVVLSLGQVIFSD